MTKGTKGKSGGRKAGGKAAPEAQAPAAAPEVQATAQLDRVGKGHFSELIANGTGISRAQSAAAFDTVLQGIADALKAGKSVNLPGIGSLRVRETAARSGVRPGTTERIQIPAGKKVGFKASSTLRDEISR